MINIDANYKDKSLITHYFNTKDYENLFYIAMQLNINNKIESEEYVYKQILEELYNVSYLQAYNYLGHFYFNQNNISLGLKILKEGASKECVSCLTYLGEIYFIGYSVEKNFDNAIEYYEKAALLNDHFSIKFISSFFLCDLYPYKGLKSLNIFNRGKKLNIRDSLLCLVKIYESQKSETFDLGVVVSMKEKLLDEDNHEEVKELAFYYLKKIDNSNERYTKRMIELFEISANNDDIDSLCILGYFYSKGNIVKRDLQKSLVYYEKAFQLGDIFAQEEVLKIKNKLINL